MNRIDKEKVQKILEQWENTQVYIHLETTNGAYASHINSNAYNVGAYIRNANVTYTQAKIVGDGNTYRVGIKTEIGWIYAEGLTDWVMQDETMLLLAGHDAQGRLMVALQISEKPFGQEGSR